MSLIRKFELSLHVVEASCVLLNSLLFVLVGLFSCFLRRLDLLEEVVMASKKFLGVNLADFAQRNIWNFMLETTMNVDIVA